MSEPVDFPDADRELLHRYLDGELSEAECTALEARLDQDEALAREHRDMARLRAALECLDRDRLAGSGAGRRGGGGRRRWLFILAAATLVAALGSVWWRRASRDSLDLAVAALETRPVLTEWNASLGLPPDYLPRGNGPRGEAPAPGTPGAREYAERVRELFARRTEESFGNRAAEIRATHYVVAVRPERACSVVVVSLDTLGRARREFPIGEADNAARLPSQGTWILPRDVVKVTPRSEADEAVDFSYGFHVPGEPGVTDVAVLIAARDREVVASDLATIDEWLTSAVPDRSQSVRDLRERFERDGFRVQELRVRAE